MPTLQAEATVFPENLFDSIDDSVRNSDRSWWVMQTKAKQEKAVAREHYNRCMPYFLPTTRRSRIGGRRERTSFIPLFTSYVFGYLTEPERFEINRTGRISTFVPVTNQSRMWEELGNLYALLDRGLVVHPVMQIRQGSLVTVRSGSLKGIRGIVQRSAGRCRFVVLIDFLQAGASVEIDEADLELSAE
jgi:transcription antitermination factor NusG